MEKKVHFIGENQGLPLYTIEEASKLLNLKISRLRKSIFCREITYIKLGALIRFRKVDLENFIESNLVACN